MVAHRIWDAGELFESDVFDYAPVVQRQETADLESVQGWFKSTRAQ